MKKLSMLGAGILLSTSMMSSAFADTITMWTMEEQPDRMAAQERIAAAFNAATGHTVNVVAVSEKDIATRATVQSGCCASRADAFRNRQTS
jgi:multiple sugar transport system substrate-binding protein